MTVSASAPARDQVLDAVHTGIRSLSGQRWTAPQADALCRVMDHALAAEDAYLALLCAQEQFGGA